MDAVVIEKKASSFAYLILFIIDIILIIVAAGFAANAAAKLKLNSAYNSDSNLKKARTYLITSAVIGIVIAVFLIVVTVMFSAKAYGFILALLIIAVLLAITIAVLCWLAASEMKKSSAYTGQGSDKTALNSAYIAAGVATGAAILTFVGIFLYTSARKKFKASITTVTPQSGSVTTTTTSSSPLVAAAAAAPIKATSSSVSTESLLSAAQTLSSLASKAGYKF